MIAKIVKHFCRYVHKSVMFCSKEKAQILVDRFNKNCMSQWQKIEIKKCLFCGRFHVKYYWTREAKTIRRSLGIK